MKTRHFILIGIILLAALLRLYALDKFPSGLNADEAAIGYNAYSLLTTGKDEHGESWPIVFKSFGDYKPGGYFYLVLPFVKAIGLNVWAVRLSSAILGILSVGLIYLLAGELARLSAFKASHKFQLLASLMLAISPWHLQFSRGGWETNAATTMILGGTYFFLKSLRQQSFIFISLILFIFSMYTYQSTRLIAPLLIVALVLVFRKNFWPPQKKMILFGVLSLVLLIPLGLVVLSPTGLSRFSGVGLSADVGPIARVNELRGQHPSQNDLVARITHNKVAAYLFLFGKNYLDHFNGNFLFVSGDPIERNKVPGMGQLYLIETPLFLAGIFLLAKIGGKFSQIIFLWLVISPLAGALTFQTPHALRSLNMVIPVTLLSSLGLTFIIKRIKGFNQPLILLSFLVIAAGYLWCFTRYLNEYYLHYPKTYSSAWEYGFSEVTTKLEPLVSKYDRIIFTDTYDQPYIEMLFFLKYNPEVFQKEVILSPRDKFGFSTVRGFGKFKFTKVSWDNVKDLPNTLVVGTPAEIPLTEKVFDTVYFPNGQPAFEFADTST